jgi:hypothetical protein
VTGFLDRLVAQAAGTAAGLEPRPRYRFADRPAFASAPPASDPSASNPLGANGPLQAGFVFEHFEAADRGEAQPVDVASLPFETRLETDGGSRLPDEAEAVPTAGVSLPLGPQFGQRSAASRPGLSRPRELPSDEEIAGRSRRTPHDVSDDDGLLMPVAKAEASGGWLRAEDAGAPRASGEYGDSGFDEGRVATGRGRNASGRFRADTAMRERRFAAGTMPPIFVARGMAAAAEVPAVVVRIGRIDVRAVHATNPSSTPAVTPKSRLQTPSLDAYLRGRDRRGR